MLSHSPPASPRPCAQPRAVRSRTHRSKAAHGGARLVNSASASSATTYDKAGDAEAKAACSARSFLATGGLRASSAATSGTSQPGCARAPRSAAAGSAAASFATNMSRSSVVDSTGRKTWAACWPHASIDCAKRTPHQKAEVRSGTSMPMRAPPLSPPPPPLPPPPIDARGVGSAAAALPCGAAGRLHEAQQSSRRGVAGSTR